MNELDVLEQLDQWRVAPRDELGGRSRATAWNLRQRDYDETLTSSRHRHDQHLGDQRLVQG